MGVPLLAVSAAYVVRYETLKKRYFDTGLPRQKPAESLDCPNCKREGTFKLKEDIRHKTR